MTGVADSGKKVDMGNKSCLLYTSCVDHHVMGAVHRAQDVALALHLHGGEHILAVVVPVAGSLVQIHGADAGSHDVQIAAGALLLLEDVYKRQPCRGERGAFP